ncbi:MAG TPA: leucyl aminopeptidase [Bacteroidetes bacterium]|nr:leucyl aminopeptidase [Bacteroidota bacterium]
MKFSLSHSTNQYPDLMIVPVAKKDDSDPFFSAISSISKIPSGLIKKDFSGDAKEVHTLYYTSAGENKRIHLLGLGENPGTKDIIDIFRSFAYKRKSHLSDKIGLHFLFNNAPSDPCPWIEAAVNGILLGFYDIGLYKTEKKEKPTAAPTARINIFVAKEHAAAAKAAMKKGQAMAETQLQIFDLVNAPSNKKTPQTLADWALRSGKKYGYKVKVLGKKEIESLGLHALLAVNQGSENPPSFIIMEYKPARKAVKKIGLVGKGVTFDTGGLSIKPSTNMHYMKTDMGGAAAVMGTMEMAAKMKLPVHLFGVVPATENSVDSKSVKPGDVIGSYAGKTIEVIDTDAEGRLILADGLAYVAKHFNPDVLIDLATLTGSCIRTLGTYAGGLFSNNDELSQQLLKASQQTGERLWLLPIWDDYKKEIKSDIADVKNFSGNPSAGAITAAKFLEIFIQDHPAWAHMDIAGVAVSDSEFSSQKSATAFGVRLLIEYLENIVNTA